MSERGDMPAAELRRHAHDIADWIADFLENIGERPVLPAVRPGALAETLPEHAPARGEPMERILADFREQIVPSSTQWNHPGFMAYFANTASGPGILAEALTAALNANAMLWRTGPAATELESTTLDWLRQMLGLPEGFHGHINDTASISTIVALAAARHRASGGAVRTRGVNALKEPRIYCSVEAHSSVEKAAILLGFGSDSVTKIGIDDEYRMIPDELRRAITADRAEGHTPVAVVATAGTTSTTSVDPVAAVADICQEEGIFLHVDAAYGGSLAVAEEFRWILDGVDRADSLVVNPHKWLFVPMDCSCLFVKDLDLLRDAFTLVPVYLRSSEDPWNLMNYGPALGRRFRALKLWMVFRYFGSAGIAERLRHHVELAREFRAAVDARNDWRVLAPSPMSVVLFRHEPAELSGEDALRRHNQRVLDEINATGRFFLSSTELRGGEFALRVAVGNLRTTREHVHDLWQNLEKIARLRSGGDDAK